jgi:hypothetical protein
MDYWCFSTYLGGPTSQRRLTVKQSDGIPLVDQAMKFCRFTAPIGLFGPGLLAMSCLGLGATLSALLVLSTLIILTLLGVDLNSR